MKKTLLTLLGLMLVPAMAMASPSFSGRWVMAPSASTPNPYPFDWLARPMPEYHGRFFQYSMTVQQNGDDMKVQDIERPVRTYTLDGQPHTRSTDSLLEKAQVTAEMQGNDVVINTAEPYSGMPGNATLNEKQVWSLSPDGNTLTIIITRTTPGRKYTLAEVFERGQGDYTTICSDGCLTIQ